MKEYYVFLQVLQRRPKMSNFVDFMGHKIVYKRYASLYFCCAVDQDDNELEVLEVIHRKQILTKIYWWVQFRWLENITIDIGNATSIPLIFNLPNCNSSQCFPTLSIEVGVGPWISGKICWSFGQIFRLCLWTRYNF